MTRNPAIKQIGELVLRVNDLDKMVAFYRDVIGLEIISDQSPAFVFFKVSEGVDARPQAMALFSRSSEVPPSSGTLDHFAFTIDLADHETEKRRLESLGVPVFVQEFPIFRHKGLFFADPEGNTVEFVCYDPDLK